MVRALITLLPAALLLGLFGPCSAQPRHAPAPGISRLDLSQGWAIQSSARVRQSGDRISTPAFDARSWYPTAIPSTVIAALVNNLVYPDPYYGMNLRSIPGTTYDFGDDFTHYPTPSDSPFAVSWWYRTTFTLPRAAPGKRLWLNFDSINYRADIWLNGRRIAATDQVRGMYRSFEFDITDTVVRGANTLAVEVFPPGPTDLTINFVDWNPIPADKDMGIVRGVSILTTGPVAMRNVQVVTRLNAALDEARLTLAADLNNAGAEPLEGTLSASIGAITLSKTVKLEPGESARIVITPADEPSLIIPDPQLWWPAGLGPQTLQQLHMEFASGGVVSDRRDVTFGIREFTSELDAQQHRLFRINGKRILIRGAAWTPDMMLRPDPERDDYQLRYAREMHLNAIRLEGRLEMEDRFFDLADRYGILVMPGWCCCSYWEEWDKWVPGDYTVAGESLRCQLRRLRNHPSVFVFLYGSDNAPPPQAEQVYLDVLRGENWPNPYLSSASDHTTAGAGRTGVKMTGPYDYVAPNYWLQDTAHGGAFGFITETSPGPAIPLLASLRQMLPPADLWPIGDTAWNFHAGSGSFADVNRFTAALEARYGKARDLADYVKKSQAMTYEAERAMFEAYGRNKYTSTGVIQWMLNNSWPGLIWHLYDWYLRPGGGYFGTRKANEPLHVQYSYDDRSIVIVNSLYQDFPRLTVTANVYNSDLTAKFSRTATVYVAEDSATRVWTLPEIAGLSTTYFVRLQLRDDAGALVSSNFYWLSTQPDVSDWPATEGAYTPVKTYADLTGLQALPPAPLTVTWHSEAAGPDQIEHVVVSNPSSQLAFFVHLTVLQGKDGADIAPVYWSDNYFELFPGESRELTATYPRQLLGGAQSHIQVDSWNPADPGSE